MEAPLGKPGPRDAAGEAELRKANPRYSLSRVVIQIAGYGEAAFIQLFKGK